MATMIGVATYQGFEFDYELDVLRDFAEGTLRFQQDSAPIHKWRAADADPNAPYRVVKLHDGATLHFRVQSVGTESLALRNGRGDVDMVVRVRGRLEQGQ